ncbi:MULTISPECIES: polysaccharide biosynthesis tyrosine autokinase [Ramlibacter]|nr:MULTISPECIES: polysaccharide biosynthesis tyrosine autokinase [Ramlibacter]
MNSTEEINLLEYWDIILDSRWLIAAISAAAIGIGVAYALFANPVYESNLLIQVEDSQSSAKSFLGEAASLFDVKTPATAEMEIIRSRMVIGRAVDSTLLYITARPKRPPVIGEWLARNANSLSQPGFFGVGGWVTGTERVVVKVFDVPAASENTRFTLTALGEGQFTLSGEGMKAQRGSVGVPLAVRLAESDLLLNVAELEAKAGAEFELIRHSRLETVERLQQNLKLSEKGRQSGVIDATLQDTSRTKLTTILNAIGQEYVRQNVERKAAEAQKTLSFLDVQLPQFKKQLDQSEEAYNRYRNQKGTVSLDEEARLILTQSVELQGKLLEAQQKRREFVARFTPEHPQVKTLDDQIAAWSREIATLNSRVKGLPSVQQEAVRLERDVKVNNELYQQLRNNALQMQLIREGKIGNVRLIDPAIAPIEPVRPRKSLTVGIAALVGLLGGILLALARASFFRGVRSPQEVEAETGLSVYSTVPLSDAQQQMARLAAAKAPGLHVLAHAAPQDIAVEALRSLRTALQFAMLESNNNRVLITGGTPGVGKSFVSVNFSAVLASAGKRVLLIDADLRKGHLNQYFGIPRDGGLSELMAGQISSDQAIRHGILPQFDFLPTGALPPNPAELVGSAAFAALLEKLSAQYDLVVIDSAPVLVAADTLSIAAHAGTLLLVARAELTTIGDLHESARRLAHSGKAANGVLFNALDVSRRHYGKYGYKYGGYSYVGYRYGSKQYAYNRDSAS